MCQQSVKYITLAYAMDNPCLHYGDAHPVWRTIKQGKAQSRHTEVPFKKGVSREASLIRRLLSKAGQEVPLPSAFSPVTMNETFLFMRDHLFSLPWVSFFYFLLKNFGPSYSFPLLQHLPLLWNIAIRYRHALGSLIVFRGKYSVIPHFNYLLLSLLLL